RVAPTRRERGSRSRSPARSRWRRPSRSARIRLRAPRTVTCRAWRRMRAPGAVRASSARARISRRDRWRRGRWRRRARPRGRASARRVAPPSPLGTLERPVSRAMAGTGRANDATAHRTATRAPRLSSRCFIGCVVPKRNRRHRKCAAGRRVPQARPSRAAWGRALFDLTRSSAPATSLTVPDFLLELFSEQIPARMQARAAEDLRKLVTEALVSAGLLYEGAKAFVTPRRLALAVKGVPVRQPDVKEEKKGPRVGAPEGAIQGFLRAAGLKSISEA